MTAAAPIHVLHDAATLARLVGAAPPGCDGLVLPIPPTGPPIAAVVESNPLAEGWLLDLELPCDRIITWSGTPAEGLFDEDPRAWMRPGREAFRALCDGAAPTLLRRGQRLAFRPHARHVLNDVQGSLNFLREREGQPFELALAPADLLTEEMLPAAEEHLERIFEVLGPRAAVLFLTDRAPPGSALFSCPFGEGVLPAAHVLRLLRACVPPSTPIILLPERLAEQRARLEAE